MTRFFKRLLFALITLGLGALGYALLRAEAERSLRPVPQEPSTAPPPDRPRREPAAEPEPVAEPPVCAATTKSGKPCARAAQPGSRYCWQHGG